MIFVTTGTCMSFHRLVKHIDNIAPQLKEKVIAQIGHSLYIPQNIEFQRFYPSLESFVDDSRLVITHGGFSAVEIIKAKKPCIIVPRQKKFEEHFDNHQIEFAELLHIKCGISFILDLFKLTPELIQNHDDLPIYDGKNLSRFQDKIQNII